MKLLYIPLLTATPETDDLYKAFCKKCDALWYWGNRSISAPDVIYFQSGAIPVPGVEIMKSINPKAIITQWTGDYRPEGFDYFREAGKYCDVSFKADLENLYPELNCKFLPHGVAEWQFREINPDAKGIIFIGNAYTHLPGGKERYDLCKELSKRDDFAWWGTGSPNGSIEYIKTPDEYNKHKFAICSSVYNDAKGYFGQRPLHAMAAGCCAIIRDFPNDYDFFPSIKTCIKYSPEVETLYDLWYKLSIADVDGNMLSEEQQTIEIRKNGQQLIRDNFTYDKIVESYLKQI